MVAERRERRGAAPTSWIPPEPAGKGKPLGSKKKAASGATKKKQPAKTAATSAASAASDSVAHPASAAGQAAVSHVGGAAAIAGGGEQHHAAEHGGGLGQDDYALDGLQSATSTANPTVSGGSGPIETDTGEQLFCICMGVDNGTPMIFCEACENWFHFECIGLSEEDASRIATYYCDQCEQAGSGKTEWSYDAPSTFDDLPSFPTEAPLSSPPPTQNVPLSISAASHLPTPLPLPSLEHVMTPSDSGEEEDNADDGDYFTSGAAGDGEDTRQLSSSSRRIQEPPSDDEEDDEYEEGSSINLNAKRKKKDPSSSTTTAIVGTSRLPPLKPSQQRRKSSSAGNANSSAKRRKRVVEDEEEAEERRRKAAASTTQFYGSSAKPGPSSADPLSNPTRKHCIEQLEKILEAIFTAAQTASEAGTEAGTTTVSPSKAREYAEAVEKELFQHNCEPDPKNPHNLTHSKKYTAKFRTLHFNLKSNDYFRSRVASGALDAAKIYAMDQEDLLSPEVRAEQEAERARLLAQSVKVAAVQPKTKITHKGEEILDEFDSAGAAAGSTGTKGPSERDTRMGENERRDSMSASVMGDTPHIPNDGGFEAFRERSMSIQAGSPRMEHGSPRFGSPPVFTDSPTGRAFSPVEDALRDQMTASPDKIVSENVREETEEFARPAMPHHSRSDSQSKSKLDLDAVWSTLQPAAPSASPEKEAAKESSEPPKEKEEDDMEMDSDEDGSASGDKKAGSEDKQVAEEYDPFSTEGRKKSDADDEFDALMGGEEAPRDKKAKEQSSIDAVPTAAKPSDKSLDEIANLPPVWEGQIAVPDEGSFSARLVQVGGTPFGPHPSIWDRILPKGKIEITGRIDEKAASEYVVQSNFSHSRENVVLAILPANPSNNPAEYEKAEAAYSQLVKFYAERKRYGVAPPTAELKKVAKDHYIVPLKQDRALPDYVEILDSHVLPDKGSRKRDYLLSVLVLQKGLGLNTTHRTSTNSGGSTPQSSQGQTQAGAPAVANQYGHLQPPQASISSNLSPSGQYGTAPQVPFSSNMSPPYQPPGVQTHVQGTQGAAPALDPAALQSLLSNPSLLQALSTTGAQQGSPIPPPAPTYGAFSPPPPSSMGIGGIGTYTTQPEAPAWGAPPQQQPPIQQYGAFPPPPPAQWNPAGSPPWQGQAGPPPPQAWGAPTNHPPGYIDPERIKAASAEARRIAEQDRMEKARRTNEGGGGPYSRGSGNANGSNSRSGGRSRGNGNGHGRKGDSGMNQMQAGIQDRGWGRRG